MAKKMSALDKVKELTTRFDGWKNILTGLGVKGTDRRKASCITWNQMDESEAEDLYAGSDVARKIADEVVAEAFREGSELKADDLATSQQSAITDEEERLQVDQKLAEAWRLARLYGGSAIIPIPRDVKLLAAPYVPSSIDKIQNLLVLSRWELPYDQIERDVRLPNFGNPKNYRICPRSGGDQNQALVHHSWLLRFDGAYLPRTLFQKNNLWHDSILNVCKIPIRDYDAALASLSATLDDFSVAVLKMKDLTRMIGEDRDDLVTKRLEIANMSRSVAKMIVLDAEAEDFKYQDRQLTGVADAVRMIAGRLVVASNMPHTKILGESPDGSNATGNSTTKDWYDHVRSQQENFLDPRALTLRKAILSAKKSPTNGVVPKGLKIVYAPLWQEPESTQADIKLKTAQTDQIYITNDVLDPAEVAVSRFGSGEFSTSTQLLEDRTAADMKPDDAEEGDDPADAPKPGEKGVKPGDKKDPKKAEKPAAKKDAVKKGGKR